ncbi:gas vesicle protein GvpFL [Limnospira fusiformis CCALA 023]|uniref:GvpL/GvpF family gas vesicle protein n=1 Tax=Limnospira platensis TaxID=118562 RepID=UPI00396D3464
MYVYAFIKSQSISWKSVQGIYEPVVLLEAGALAAVVEPNLQAENLSADNEEELMRAVLTHDRIVCQIFEETTVLPVRFGTCFDSEARLCEHLTTEGDRYFRQLEKLTGRAEYLLEAIPQPFNQEKPFSDTTAPPTKGRDYFLQKKRLHQQRLNFEQQQEQQWQDFINAIASKYPIVQGKATEDAERIYLLIPRSQEVALVEWVAQQQQNIDLWEFSLGNAVPAYHFL